MKLDEPKLNILIALVQNEAAITKLQLDTKNATKVRCLDMYMHHLSDLEKQLVAAKADYIVENPQGAPFDP